MPFFTPEHHDDDDTDGEHHDDDADGEHHDEDKIMIMMNMTRIKLLWWWGKDYDDDGSGDEDDDDDVGDDGNGIAVGKIKNQRGSDNSQARNVTLLGPNIDTTANINMDENSDIKVGWKYRYEYENEN